MGAGHHKDFCPLNNIFMFTMPQSNLTSHHINIRLYPACLSHYDTTKYLSYFISKLCIKIMHCKGHLALSAVFQCTMGFHPTIWLKNTKFLLVNVQCDFSLPSPGIFIDRTAITNRSWKNWCEGAFRTPVRFTTKVLLKEIKAISHIFKMRTIWTKLYNYDPS